MFKVNLLSFLVIFLQFGVCFGVSGSDVLLVIVNSLIDIVIFLI